VRRDDRVQRRAGRVEAEAADAEWHHGHQGVVKCGVKMWSAWEDMEVVPSEFVDGADDALMVSLEVAATGKISGARTSQTIYAVVTLRGGLFLRLVGYSYTSRAEALKAAGLSG
jgi:hypothetical protein